MRFLRNWFAKFNKTTSRDSGTKIIVAEVLASAKHPNADRLRVVDLDVGHQTISPVVCGASNFEVGDKVVLALPGALVTHNLHDAEHKSFILSKATIRGVESQGMICAAFELGLGPLSERPEILVLKPAARPGSPFNPDMVE